MRFLHIVQFVVDVAKHRRLDTKLTELFNPCKQAQNEIAVHLSSYLLTAVETKSGVAKLNSAEINIWLITCRVDIEPTATAWTSSMTQATKLPVGPQDCKTWHTIVKYSC